MDQQQMVVKSEDGGDRVSKTKTIYDASVGEIIWKNFLAGLSRTIGGIFIYLIFIFIISGVFLNVVLPKIMPSITSYTNLIKSFGSTSNTKPGTGNIIPQNIDLQKIFGQ